MKSILENIENEIIIDKSKFITKLIKVNNINDINYTLQTTKLKYKDATHHCYAYIIDNYKRASDDGEPSGTAGMPILNVLENNNLNYILCIVIRYFGGIKLGAGGLVRAYSKSVTSCLELAQICELTYGYLIEINFKYDNIKQIDYLLKDYIILSKEFQNNISYVFKIKQENYSNLLLTLKPYILNSKIKNSLYIEKIL